MSNRATELAGVVLFIISSSGGIFQESQKQHRQ
jgi:hypothetical protein